VNSDDGFRLTVRAAPQDTNVALGFFNGGRGAADTVFDFQVSSNGLYPFRLTWEQGLGNYSVEWFSVADDGTRTLINGTNAAGQVPVPAYRYYTTLVQPPVLNMSWTQGILILSWDPAQTTIVLETTPSLSPPVWWTLVTGVVNNRVTVPTEGTMRFYRLRR
jgi:hypothetical protein